MSSGFPGGHPDYLHLNTTGRSIPLINLTHNNGNNVVQNNYRSPLAGILSDTSSNIGLRRPDLIGKRSLAEFQHHQQLQQQAAFFLRNVKHRSYNNIINNNNQVVGDFPISPEISSLSSVSLASNNNNNNYNNNNNTTSSCVIPRYGVPVMQQVQVRPGMQSFNLGNGSFNGVNTRNSFSTVSLSNIPAKQRPLSDETDGKMMKRLQELEKELLLDDEDVENNVSGVTNSEWSENILIPVTKPENIVSLSPTSSSSSSCASSSASVCPTQLFSDVAAAIVDGKQDSAAEMLTRVVSNAIGTPEQRLSFYMTSALRFKLSLTSCNSSELYGKDHILSTHLLYDKCLSFKLGFMAANSAIIDIMLAEKNKNKTGSENKNKKIHVVDFDIGQGNQYVYLLKDIAAAREARVGDDDISISIRLTTFADFVNGDRERLLVVCDGLKAVANKLGVCFSYDVLDLSLCDLNTSSLKVEVGEVLVVNLAFKLYKLPDESVTTENVRDELLRRVKGLSPALVTVVEQELNANTASFETRVSQVTGYYGALMESLDAIMGRDDSDRVKIEEGLSRKMTNSVACEGKNRVERCEVFGKWRARMSMAGFELNPMSQLRAESLLMKVNSVTRGNPGFTAKEEAGGISFGWMGRTLTVASAWH